MHRMPPLNALRVFDAAARHLSFKNAAAELGVTPTAVSHQIRQLEAILGCALFLRRTRAIALTHDGGVLALGVAAGLDTIRAAVAAVAPSPPRQVATLSATIAFCAHWLVPRIADFRAAAPGWSLRLNASDELVDLAAGEADAAIRYGATDFAGLEATRLFDDRFIAVCSPALAAAVAAGQARWTPIDFEWHQPRRTDPPSWRRWVAAHGDPGLETSAALAFDDEAHALAAAVAGQGVALASSLVAQAALDAGTLVRAFDASLPGFTHHLVRVARAGPGGAAGDVLARWIGGYSTR